MSATLLLVLAGSAACAVLGRPREGEPTQRPTVRTTATSREPSPTVPAPEATAPAPTDTESVPYGNLVDAPSVACVDLGSTWSDGTAPARSDGTGYDVTACTRSTAGGAELVKPAERDPARWAGARANDGTPFAFEVQLSPSGSSRVWVIYLQGGGFCDDNANLCRARAPRLSSSPEPPDRAFGELAEQEGIFNRSPAQNPTFHDANLVFAYYVSSDQWSGATAERRPTTAHPAGWYFSGRANVRAMVGSLVQRYGLDDGNPETRVLFIGTSAGGIGVQTNADILAELLPRTAAAGRLKLVNDGGFATEFDDPAFRPGEADEPWAEVLQQAYDFWGAQLNPLCEEAQRQAGEHPGRCALGAVNYPFTTQPPPTGLGLPLLVQIAQVDSSLMDLHNIEDLSQPEALEAIELMRAAALEAIEGVEWLFSAGDRRYHTIINREGARRGWNMGPEGMTFQEVLTRFWEGGLPERVIFGSP